MKKQLSYFLSALLSIGVYSGCSEDSEPKLSNEAALLSLSFDNEYVKGVALTDTINWIYLSNELSREELSTLTFMPKLEVSPNATVIPAPGTAIPLNENFEIKVTAQDGKTTNVYKMGIMRKATYTFDADWVLYNEEQTPETGFYTPANRWWDTSNTGVFFIRLMMAGEEIPMAVEQVKEGKELTASAKIQTVDSKGKDLGSFFPKIPKVTSGTLFNGVFITDFKHTLNSTKFGTPFTDGYPVNLVVNYKYTAGETYYHCPDPDNSHLAEPQEGKLDEYSIVAVLYEVENEKDVLTGLDINTSDKVVYRAEKYGVSCDWNKATIPFALKKAYDSTKSYKLAIVLSSSRWGDTFSGAPGSALVVESIELDSYNEADNRAAK